jgi:hypothetical protein
VWVPVAAQLLTVTVLDVVSVVAPTEEPETGLLVIVAPVIEPPVIATLAAFCVAIVPNPDTSVDGIVALAVSGVVPEPFT